MYHNVIQKRVLYKTGYFIPRDKQGLLPKSCIRATRFPNIFWDDRLTDLDGGVIVAEGGMGKTTLAGEIANRLGRDKCLLVDLANSIVRGRARVSVNQFIQNGRFEDSKCFVVFDGVDGTDETIAEISDIILTNKKRCIFWTMVRDPVAGVMLNDACRYQGPYNLASLTADDVRMYSEAVLGEVEGRAFLAEVSRRRLMCACANPLGLRVLIESYRDSDWQVSHIASFRKFMMGFCRAGSSLASKNRSSALFDSHRVYDCAQYVAYCMVLANRFCVSAGGTPDMPLNSTLYVDDLKSEEYSADLIHQTLQSGIFATAGRNVCRFSHDSFRNFLCAEYFSNKLDRGAVEHILFDSKSKTGYLYPQRSGIAALMAFENKWLFNRLLALQPEVLLYRCDAYAEAQRLAICKRIVEDSDRLRVAPLFKRISSSFARLRCERCNKYIIRTMRKGDPYSASLMMALSIAEACEIASQGGGYNSLVKIICNEAFPIEVRTTAVRIMKDVGNMPSVALPLFKMIISKQESLSRELLQLNVAVFKLFWPNWIAVSSAIRLIETCREPRIAAELLKVVKEDTHGIGKAWIERGSIRREFCANMRWCLSVFSNYPKIAKRKLELAKVIVQEYGKVKSHLDEECSGILSDLENEVMKDIVQGPVLPRGNTKLGDIQRGRAHVIGVLLSSKRAAKSYFSEVVMLLNDKVDENAHPPLELERSRVWGLLSGDAQERIRMSAIRYVDALSLDQEIWDEQYSMVARRAVVLAYGHDMRNFAVVAPGVARAFALSLLKPIRKTQHHLMIAAITVYAELNPTKWMDDLVVIWHKQKVLGSPSVFKQFAPALNQARTSKVMDLVRRASLPLADLEGDMLDAVLSSSHSSLAYSYLSEMYSKGARICSEREAVRYLSYALMRPQKGINFLLKFMKEHSDMLVRCLRTLPHEDMFFNVLPYLKACELRDLFFAVTDLLGFASPADSKMLKFVEDFQDAVLRAISVREEKGVVDIIKSIPCETGNARTDREQLCFSAQESELRASLPTYDIAKAKALVLKHERRGMSNTWFTKDNVMRCIIAPIIVGSVLTVIGLMVRMLWPNGEKMDHDDKHRDGVGVDNRNANINQQIINNYQSK